MLRLQWFCYQTAVECHSASESTSNLKKLLLFSSTLPKTYSPNENRYSKESDLKICHCDWENKTFCFVLHFLAHKHIDNNWISNHAATKQHDIKQNEDHLDNSQYCRPHSAKLLSMIAGLWMREFRKNSEAYDERSTSNLSVSLVVQCSMSWHIIIVLSHRFDKLFEVGSDYDANKQDPASITAK